jgi:glycosyltransferase involved in cell wall biosynthesis
LPEGVIGNSVPSKIGLLMACKKPVISTSDQNSLYLKMINDNSFGYGYGTKEYEKVANAILELSKNPEKCMQMGENGYNFGHLIFSRSFNTGKYISLFERLSSGEDKN